MTRPRLALLVAAAAALSGLTLLGSPAQAAPVQAPQPAARYVALGSSYAAGGGLGTPDPAGFPGCGRTTMAYPYLVAGALDLDLVNAACGGATIDNITGTPQRLQGWDGSISSVPRQIESVGSDTGLVTITIGGNDVNYVGNLEMDMNDGELRVRTILEGDSLIGEPMIDRAIRKSLDLADQYQAALLSIAFGNALPADVLAMASCGEGATLQ